MKKLIIFLGLLAIAFLFMYYSAQLVEMFGVNAWAEKYVGSTRTMYVLIGFGIAIVAFLYLFGAAKFGFGG